MAQRSIEHTKKVAADVIDMKTGERAEVTSVPVICANIRRHRLRMKLEQKQLAELIGVSKNSVGNWETGRSRPDISMIPLICRAFRISPAALLGIEEEKADFSSEEQALIEKYRGLTPGHKYTVRSLMDALHEVQEAERRRPQLYPISFYEKPLAAGIGDPTEYEGKSHTMYLHDTPELRRADCLYKVNGNSMEPDFYDGDLVFVERITDTLRLKPGEIGAFIVGNELYIKQYERDGLHSLNEDYPVMKFEESDTRVYLLGRVLGVVDPDLIATEEEIEDYEINHTEE